MKPFFYICFGLFLCHSTQAQRAHDVYSFNNDVDLPIIGVGSAWSIYCFTKIYSKGNSKEADILKLDRNKIWTINRWAIYPYSKRLDRMSWYPFLAAMPLPFVFFGSGDAMRRDQAQLNYMYFEAMSISGLLGTAGPYFLDKYRPYSYSEETPMEQRIYQGGKNSFYAGHVTVVATSTFLVASVYSDYYPESDAKWVFYGVASAATAFTAYGRLKSGMHFPTDIILGAVVGIASGILVPYYHRNNP